MKISYGITVYNEAEELHRLLDILNLHIDSEDEIVVCVDGDDEKVESVLGEYLSENKAIVYKRKLDGNFADHKNSVIEKSSGDYIFHIEDDEYPNKILLQQQKSETQVAIKTMDIQSKQALADNRDQDKLTFTRDEIFEKLIEKGDVIEAEIADQDDS